MYITRLSRRVHSSWHFAALFFGITIGVIGSQWVPCGSFVSIAWLVAGILLAGIGFWRQRAVLMIAFFVAGGMIGLWRGCGYQAELLPYEGLIGSTVEIAGKVMDDADTGKHEETILRLGDITANDYSIAGSIWVSIENKAMVKRGDKVTVRGELSEGFGSFAASMHRAKLARLQRPEPGDVALRARDWFADGVRQAIPEPEASLGVGYLVGERRSLPEDLDKALQAAGLTHIVVASGYNLTILVGVARRLFEKISKFLATFVSSAMVVGFVAVTGMSPSMSRAGLVTGLGLLAWYYGRRFHPLVLLPFAATITLLVNPSYGQNDLGWQLSFASFAGVLLVAPLLQSYFYGDEKPGIIRQVLGETISAWLCTVPLIVLAFGQFSNVAIMANLLILPLVPLAMLLTFLAGTGALIFPSIALAMGFPALVLLGYMTALAAYLGNVPWAQTTLSISPYAVVLYYVVLIVASCYLWYKTRYDFIGPANREQLP